MIHFVEQLVKAYHKLDVFSDESKLVQVLQSHPPTRLELATRLNRLMVDDERMEKAALIHSMPGLKTDFGVLEDKSVTEKHLRSQVKQ